jgi:hypothetical protein
VRHKYLGYFRVKISKFYLLNINKLQYGLPYQFNFHQSNNWMIPGTTEKSWPSIPPLRTIGRRPGFFGRSYTLKKIMSYGLLILFIYNKGNDWTLFEAKTKSESMGRSSKKHRTMTSLVWYFWRTMTGPMLTLPSSHISLCLQISHKQYNIVHRNYHTYNITLLWA